MKSNYNPDVSCCIQKPNWDFHFEIFEWCRQNIGENDYSWKHENTNQITIRYFFTNIENLTRFKLVWM